MSLVGGSLLILESIYKVKSPLSPSNSLELAALDDVFHLRTRVHTPRLLSPLCLAVCVYVCMRVYISSLKHFFIS